MTNYPVLSVITATIGRPSLNAAVISVNDLMSNHYPGDVEHLICGDGIDPYNVLNSKLVTNNNTRVFTLPSYGHEAHIRNVAVAMARGKWIAFLDDDDTIGSNYFKDLLYVNFRQRGNFIKISNQTLPITDKYNNVMYDESPNELSPFLYHIIPKFKEVIWGNIGIAYCYPRKCHLPIVPSRHEDLLHVVAMEAAGTKIVWPEITDAPLYFGKGVGRFDY